jgi:hypothetical protein
MWREYFRRRSEVYYPDFLYRLVFDLFAIVECWVPDGCQGPERGRVFEALFREYCRHANRWLTETAGSRTLRYCRSASGFAHETDAVIATPDLTVHCELKHLSGQVGKNDLLIFNQKGLDFLAGDSGQLRERPLYRVLVSGGPLSGAARRFALQWGILTVEPGRMPLLLLHWFSGRVVPGLPQAVGADQDLVWDEIPALIAPLQRCLGTLCSAVQSGRILVTEARLDRMLVRFQRDHGDAYLSLLDRTEPNWLADRFDAVVGCRNLCLPGVSVSGRIWAGAGGRSTRRK